jgi:hypothetical protein
LHRLATEYRLQELPDIAIDLALRQTLHDVPDHWRMLVGVKCCGHRRVSNQRE